jgi:type I restriction enzyme S subunit
MQKQFVDIVSSLRAQIDALGAQVEALSKARDMLLPKLMSGKLDVSSIRLPEEATA